MAAVGPIAVIESRLYPYLEPYLELLLRCLGKEMDCFLVKMGLIIDMSNGEKLVVNSSLLSIEL